MSAQERHEAWVIDYFTKYHKKDAAAYRSALGDAAHLCDNIAADVLAEHTIRGRPTKLGRQLEDALKRAGNACWQLRERLP